MLKRLLDNLDGLSEEIKALYEKQADGKWHLAAEEDPELKAKLDEFRQNNIKLTKDQAEMKKVLDSINIEEYNELKKTKQSLDDKKLIESGKLEEVVAQRTERMRSDFDAQQKALLKQLEALTTERDTLGAKYSTELIEGRVMRAITQNAVPRKEAVADILNRARQTYTLENGELVPKINGKLAYGKDGKTLLSIEEFAENLVKDGPHLFEASAGGGAKGNDGKGGARGTGKIDPEVWKTLSPAEKLKQARAAEQKK